MPRRMTRRDALRILAALPPAALVGCGARPVKVSTPETGIVDEPDLFLEASPS